MIRAALLAALLALPFIAGCSNTCSSACDNIAKVCAAEFLAKGRTFDPAQCTSDCKANLQGCTNLSDQITCTATAKTCSALEQCPSCF
jgi:hypothetical protein